MSTPDHAITVCRYGLLQPIDWDQDCHEQLFLMNRFWNTLVQIEREHRAKYRSIVGEDDAVKPLQAQLDVLREEQKNVRAERKKLRAQARARVKTLLLDSRLKELANEIQSLAIVCKTARLEAKARIAPYVEALNAQHEAQVTAARQKANWGVAWEQDEALTARLLALNEQRGRINARRKERTASSGYKMPFTAEETAQLEEIRTAIATLERECSPTHAPLWWGNTNAIWDSYSAARSRAMKEGTELRFRRFTGEGRFTVQIIGGASVDQITNASKQVSLDMTPRPVPGRGGVARRGLARPRLSMTIYTRDGVARLLTWPIVYHFPLPLLARIQQVTVTRRRIGTAWRYLASFLCRIPAPPVPIHSARDAKCGINLGWRQVPEGLRIATIYTGERIEHLHLSNAWLSKMDTVEAIQQRRALALNEVHTTLRAVWPDRPPDMPESIRERFTNLVRAPKFAAGSLAAIVIRWREFPEWWPQMLDFLENWRRQDKKDLEQEANQRDALMVARREEYILAARSLLSRFALMRIGAMDLRNMARLERPDGTETELHQRARKNRHRAALFSFQSEMATQAVKFGAIVEEVTGPVTVTCHRCDGRVNVTIDLIQVCPHCSAVWDQDENAARNIFAAAPCERSDDRSDSGERSHQ